jgi:hypothetical protein
MRLNDRSGEGPYRGAGSPSVTSPRSTSIASKSAVNTLVMDPISKIARSVGQIDCRGVTAATFDSELSVAPTTGRPVGGLALLTASRTRGPATQAATKTRICVARHSERERRHLAYGG